ncbi:MAG: YibE/F family protein [Anaerolineae bacterium]|nr:MAG: YibE/F family protein [Anaerolineae bacterium]
MKSIAKPFVLAGLVVLFALLAFLVWGVPYFFQKPYINQINASLGAQTYRAHVIEILESGPIDLGGTVQTYQRARVRVVEGEYSGVLMEIDYGRYRILPQGQLLRPGDAIFVLIGKRPDGVVEAFFVDFVREQALLLLLAIFVTAILLMSRWKGLRSLLSLAFSLLVIIYYIIPHILAGEDPLQVSLIGSGLLLGVSLYLTYGWNWKTHASVLSMVFVLLITGVCAVLFVQVARLSGSGSEEALFLTQMSSVNINLRGLLLGGILIGALGVLDDLVTTQAAAVFELHHTDPRLDFRALFEKAMRIGQDHVAATVNTLVLAYAGASLPLLLLFTLGSGNYGYFINVEFVTEEIVRTLVGSLGLMAAVPLTTGLSALIVLNRHRLPEDWRALLGPEGAGHHH